MRSKKNPLYRGPGPPPPTTFAGWAPWIVLWIAGTVVVFLAWGAITGLVYVVAIGVSASLWQRRSPRE